MAIVSFDEVKDELRQIVQDALRSELEAQTFSLKEELGEIAGSGGTLEVLRGLLKVELEAHGRRLRKQVNQDFTAAAKPRKRSKESMGTSEKPTNSTKAATVDLPGMVMMEEEKLSSVVPAPAVDIPVVCTEGNENDDEAIVAKRESLTSTLKRRASQVGERIDGSLALFAEAAVAAENEDGDQVDELSCWNRFRFELRSRIRQTSFDAVIITCIVLNAIAIGIQSDWMLLNIGKEEPVVFKVFERIFAFIFLSELLARLTAFGFGGYYCGPEWRWAIFDSVIVFLQIFEEITAIVAGAENAGGGNFGFMRILRILRLIRILRLVRILRFVQELRTMVMSIAGSMKSLAWTLVLMLLMMYVIGVYFCQIIADEGLELHAKGEDISLKEPNLMFYYGGLVRSVISLYQAMTGGVDWNDLSKPLENAISPWLSLVFSLYIAFAVLAMMNVVTGVFVESALLTAREDRDKEVLSQVRQLFLSADADQNGMISWEEFATTMDSPNFTKYLSSLDIDESEAQGLFLLLDTDESGAIDSEEFIQGIIKLRGPARAIDVSTLMYTNKRMVNWWRQKIADLNDRISDMSIALGVKSTGADREKRVSRCGEGPGDEALFLTWAEVQEQAKSKRRLHSVTTDLSETSS
eukprot:TRINITY_DN78964_c0_g1_i1.p1 TRINITY_DN78964_c0_g1~~TRINITY_DN78964_c0_g1_i1.p1  ORF type:complete len:638 (+),score=135.87 TRINITY_DN78964_c0_g1_i1:66-1979(+)